MEPIISTFHESKDRETDSLEQVRRRNSWNRRITALSKRLDALEQKKGEGDDHAFMEVLTEMNKASMLLPSPTKAEETTSSSPVCPVEAKQREEWKGLVTRLGRILEEKELIPKQDSAETQDPIQYQS